MRATAAPGACRQPRRQPAIDHVHEGGERCRLAAAERVAERMQRTRIGIGQLREQLEYTLAQGLRRPVEEVDGARDAAFGGGRSVGKLSSMGIAAERGRSGARHVGGRERTQQQAAAARADGGQFAPGSMTDQQQQRARRRLLEHLEQHIGAFALQAVDWGALGTGGAGLPAVSGKTAPHGACC